jgi:hypothetical protein
MNLAALFSSVAEGSVQECCRTVYGERCNWLITTDPNIAHRECSFCSRMTVVCISESTLREGDICAQCEPLCRFKQADGGCERARLNFAPAGGIGG